MPGLTAASISENPLHKGTITQQSSAGRVFKGLGVAKRGHPPAPANLRQRLATFCLFKNLNIKSLKLALETKSLTLGLDHCLQRRGFRRQFQPQFEGDLGQACVALGDRSEQLLSFVFGHVRQNCRD